MIPDISQSLNWLEKYSYTLKDIQRGLERETLRINKDGNIAQTNHPKILGSALTHRWITTDFIESLLEFITPTMTGNIEQIFNIMSDIHRYVARNLNNEFMWPLSIPCYFSNEQEKKIRLAEYGSSNIGKLKTLYREGLKNRYGMPMQLISGVHYNFSFPMMFWKKKCGKTDKEIISTEYFRLIRNYYRFGWIIPYLFGASPAVYSSYLKNKNKITLPFKNIYNIYYLPYATSLRLSDIGYRNKLQNSLGITFNELNEYIKGLKKATKTLSVEYEKIGLKKNGKRLQINSNILQIENEFYAPIRPKRITKHGETLLDSLQRSGIEYIEVRSLDINPFSPIGINKQQIYFLDLFMLWCIFADVPEMSSEEILHANTNWDKVILEGRKDGLTLNIDYNSTQKCSLTKIGKDIFRDLKLLAKTLDIVYGGKRYQKTCDELVIYLDEPELTFSARILNTMINRGINKTGYMLALEHHNILINEPLNILDEIDFLNESKDSIVKQHEIEKSDNETFESFLKRINQ